MGTFIVTGGCGFVGSHLVDALITKGHQVHVIDDLSSGKVENLNSHAIFHKGTICDQSLLRDVFSDKIEGCFHLAAIASVEKSNAEWVKTHHINCSGSVAIFEAAARYCTPVVYASSAAVYGANRHLPLSEDQGAQPLTAYGVDKYATELHGMIASSIHNVPTMGMRFFNVYGPRQDPTSPYSGVITIFIQRLLEGKPFVLNGSGQQTRDFIYVGDVVHSLLAGMDRLVQCKKGAEIYNVCTGTGTSLLELAVCLEDIQGKCVERSHMPPRLGDIERSVGNPQKMIQALSVQARTPLKQGLKQTIESSEKVKRVIHVS